MRKRRILTVAITAVSALVVLAEVPAGAALTGSTWRATEIKLPANAAANQLSRLFAVACAGAAYCAAGGYYRERSGTSDAMVVTAPHGTWGRAQELRLPANAAANPDADVDSLACTAAGSCVAVGQYGYGSGTHDQALIATASNGKWARARTAALPANSAATPDAGFYVVSCTGPGSCVAGGFYTDKASSDQLMVAVESKGRWGRALELKLPSNAAAVDEDAYIGGLACARVGYCSAVGDYMDTAVHEQALALTESRGRWGRATEIRLPSNAAEEPYAELNSVVCSRSGTCQAVGNYVNGSNLGQVMAVTQAKGRWGRAAELRLPSNTSTTPGADGDLDGLACSGVGSCAAAGGYSDSAGHAQAMVVAQAKGKWQQAVQVNAPANAATGASQSSFLYAVACVTGGQCDAVGSYADRSGDSHPMVVVRV